MNLEPGTGDWPHIVEVQEIATTNSSKTLELSLKIPQNLECFKGHFPGQPVLPGVIQSHWAVSLSKQLFSIEEEFSSLENLKFTMMILPETDLTLKLVYVKTSEFSSVNFSYAANEQQYSQGKIKF